MPFNSDAVVRGPVRQSPPSPDVIDTLSSAVAIAALVLVVCASAMEQNPADPARERSQSSPTDSTAALAPPAAEYLFAVYGGAPYTYRSDVTVKKPGTRDFTVKDVGWDGQPFEDPIYYGARIARWFEGGRTGAMIDFTHSKALARLAEEAVFEGAIDGQPAPARARLGDVFKKLEASHGHNMLTLNGLLRLPALSFRFHPYVGLGAGVALPHSEVHVAGDPTRTYEYQYAGPVLQGLAGLEIRTPRVSYFVEYKFTFASYEMPLTGEDGRLLIFDLWRQLRRWWHGEEPPGGWASTTFTSHQLIAGLGVRVGR